MKSIFTERLIARLAIDTDAEQIFTLYTSRPEESKYLARPPHKTVEETKNLLDSWSTQSSWDQDSRVVMVIQELDSKVVFGLLTLFLRPTEIEIHFGISADFSDKGYASEILLGLIGSLRISHPSLILTSYCDIDNLKAQRVLEKVGMRQDSLQKAKYINPNLGGQAVDCYTYKMPDTDT